MASCCQPSDPAAYTGLLQGWLNRQPQNHPLMSWIICQSIVELRKCTVFLTYYISLIHIPICKIFKNFKGVIFKLALQDNSIFALLTIKLDYPLVMATFSMYIPNTQVYLILPCHQKNKQNYPFFNLQGFADQCLFMSFFALIPFK